MSGAEIRKEVERAVKKLKTEIMDELRAELKLEVRSELKKIPQTNNMQLARVDASSKEITAIVQKATDQVYDDVMNEIDRTITPKVNRMVQWVNYNTQDGAEIVDSYRRQVEKQSGPSNMMITDGKKDKRVISANVRTFFEDSSSDDGRA